LRVSKKAEVKFCPLISSTAGGWSICEEEKCALYVEDVGRCSLWLSGSFAPFSWASAKRLAKLLEEHAEALEKLAEELRRARTERLPFMRG